YTNNQQLAPGVWHSYEIKVTGRTYEVKLNGQPATTFTASSADPNAKFRGRSKTESRFRLYRSASPYWKHCVREHPSGDIVRPAGTFPANVIADGGCDHSDCT